MKKTLQLLKEDASQIYLGNLKTVEFDLMLPLLGKNGSKIIWSSTDERWIDNTGKVFRPPYGRGNRDVTLTASLHLCEEQFQKKFIVRILEAKNNVILEEIFPINLSVETQQDFYLPSFVAIKTVEQNIISQEVIWKNEQPINLSQIGAYKFEGTLKGTDYPVIAVVEIISYLNKKEDRIQKKQIMDIENINLIDTSPMKTNQDNYLDFLIQQDENQMLYNFRVATGLDTLNSKGMIGWESSESKLRGHTTGHYLSALSIAYSATKNEKLLQKLMYMVDELAEIQDAFLKKDDTKSGFISAYDETQFDLLEEFRPYPEIWAPFYTLHKIFAGLLDSFKYAKLEKSLSIASKLGDWVYNRLSKLDHLILQKMWSMYIAGEYGGMNESLGELYRITQKEEHLLAAKFFDNDRLFFPLSQKVDALYGLHANQHIPQIVGAMKVYEVSNESKYFEISQYFWDIVTEHHIYSMGGTGDGEIFQNPGFIANHISKNTAETCASYNMLKLTSELYKWNGDNKYLDYYELVLYNHIMATPDTECSGESTYFMATQPGAKRFFEIENSCCHGTGMENHFKYGHMLIAFDETSINLNFFIPSEIKDPANNIDLSIHTSDDLVSSITLNINNIGNRKLYLRKQNSTNFTYLEVDGCIHSLNPNQPFLEVPTGARKVILHTKPCLKIVETPDNPKIFSIFAGTFLLAAVNDEQNFLEFQLSKEDIYSQLKRKDNTNHYYLNDLEFIPVHELQNQHYHIYFKSL